MTMLKMTSLDAPVLAATRKAGESCEDCARRLAESTSDVSAWMMPPAIIAFWCEFRIAPNA